jgi:hypothetical protein
MNTSYAKDTVKELIQGLCRLIDSGVAINRDIFHDKCEKEQFIDFLLSGYKDQMRLSHLNESFPLFDTEIKDYLNNAFGRHANVVVMEGFGLKNNALLLGINISLSILQELDGMA